MDGAILSHIRCWTLRSFRYSPAGAQAAVNTEAWISTKLVMVVADTSAISYFVLSNHTTVFQGIDERMPNELTASALVICAQS